MKFTNSALEEDTAEADAIAGEGSFAVWSLRLLDVIAHRDNLEILQVQPSSRLVSLISFIHYI